MIRRLGGPGMHGIGGIPLSSLGGKGRGAVTVILLPDFDTCVLRNNADTAYDALDRMNVRGSGPSQANGLILPDLSSIPAGATIASATLRLVLDADSAAAVGVTIHRILAANSGWIEACTWNYADGAGATDRWAGDVGGDGGADAGCSVSGTDYAAAVVGSFTIGAADVAGTVYNVTLDAAEIATLLANNYGIVMISDTNSTRQIRSSDHAVPADRPVLTIVYR